MHCDLAGEHWLDFTLASKGTGIRTLAESLGVPLSQVAAFGDQFNDESMLEIVGRPYIMSHAPAPLLQKGSKIVMLTSELAVRDPLPFTGLYGITKTALDQYAYSLRMELQLLGVSVAVLRAGAVDTGMLGESTRQLDAFCRDTKLYTCNAERFKQIVDNVEARRIPPAGIAKKLYGIFCAKRPKFAYSINRNPLLILLDMLPKRARFYIIRSILKQR